METDLRPAGDKPLQAVLLMPSDFLGQEEYFDY